MNVTSAKNLFCKKVIVPTLAAMAPWLASAGILPVDLKCESRLNPQGIDEIAPALSWQLDAPKAERGQSQTAYRVQVASSPEILARNQGDLWDTGRVATNQAAFVPYQGPKLVSREVCYWHVQVWDKDGQPSAWSSPASWSMGLLQPNDWTAQWISDPKLAASTNRPLTPIHCYRSELASSPDAAKWIVLDLGSVKQMDAINLIPARPPGQNMDFRTPMFPARFKVEVSDNPNFSNAKLVVDQAKSDFPNPRNNSCRFNFKPVAARYARLTVTRLSCWDGKDYGIALDGFDVFDGNRVLSIGADVQCSDSIESDVWSKRCLVDGRNNVALAGDSTAIAADMKDVPSKIQVSRAPMLRREFDLSDKIKKATLYASARGFYEVRINGQRVGDEQLAPGYTDYNVRIQYQTYDVTKLLHGGKNAIGALLGYGWYAGHMNLADNRCIYGYFPQFLAQLNVELNDGTQITICTDDLWRSTLDGPVRWSDLLDGEGYDCRREMPGWDQAGFDDHSWQPAWAQPRDQAILAWQRSQPVRKIGELKPVSVKEVRPGTYVFDFGQEIAGWCRLNVNDGDEGCVRLRYAELASPDGNINVNNLWGTPQEEDYILDGHGPRVLEPHFSYHGFRYVELSGFPGKVMPDSLTAANLRTDVAVAGHFECSNELYNRIQKSAFWTQANLLFDVPNGCAARSERLAWTGDIRPCVPSLLFNFDAAGLLAKYAQDLRDDQTSEGRFTDICPHAHLSGTTICVGSPGWADAGVSLPWQVYVNTGDRRLLARHFEAAQRWVDFVHANNPDLLWRNQRGMDWGDWLSAGAATPKELGATAFFAHSTDLLSRMANALGRDAEAKKYGALFQNIRQAFVRTYANTNGIIGGTSPGVPVVRDVTTIVRSLMTNGNLSFVVENETLGGDPIRNKVKSLHLVCQIGGKRVDEKFAEGHKVDLTANGGKSVEIISASYGYDASDLGDTQGSYALALQFGLLNEPLRSKAAQRLNELVVRNGHHPTTGFWSSIELLQALSDSGYAPEAALMLNQRQKPSWGYMAEHGSTMWESFDADAQNLSLNHWTHSAVSQWLWRNVAGINPDEEHPGYQSFTIRPRLSSEVSWCKSSYDSICGRIVSEWKCDGNKFTQEITIPVNTTATVVIPASAPNTVTESGKPAAQAKGMTFLRYESGAAVYRVSSGSYHFSSIINPK